jgi:hypothetical protein
MQRRYLQLRLGRLSRDVQRFDASDSVRMQQFLPQDWLRLRLERIRQPSE